MIAYTEMASPIGTLRLAGDADGLREVLLGAQESAVGVDPSWVRDDDALGEAVQQLEAYFAGTRTTFELPLASLGTPFQRRVWQALEAIPYGQTISYAELAARIGQPRAVRAVGRANATNPLAVVVPCHRVVGRSGALTGYGGGLDRKRWLLAHEAAMATRVARPILSAAPRQAL
jgi:methylated-DNA-[protein]-cysteine S-methyltransferase